MKICYEIANKALNNTTNRAIHFIKEGNILRLSCKNKHRLSLFDGCTDWTVATDLEHHFVFPTEIALTTKHLDIVIWSIKLKTLIVIELAVPFEENFDWAHQHKLEKYEDLQEQHVRNSLPTQPPTFLTNLGLSPSDKRKYEKKIQDKALTASVWIQQSHRVTSIQQSLAVL